jgi:hypothetical protein
MAKTKGDVSKLLEETPEAYYWAGFIAADGCITMEGKRLNVNLSIADKNHLLKLARFLDCKNISYSKSHGFPMINFSLCDQVKIPKFAKKFGLARNKTYNPPNLNWLHGNKFLAFLAGYIDGDGCIRKRGFSSSAILIKGHESWKSTYSWMVKQLYLELNTNGFIPATSILKSGFAFIQLSSSPLLKEFKRKLLKLKIPLLKRKWNKIDLRTITRFERANNMRIKVLTLFNKGYSQPEIAKIIHKPYEYVQLIVYRNYGKVGCRYG